MYVHNKVVDREKEKRRDIEWKQQSICNETQPTMEVKPMEQQPKFNTNRFVLVFSVLDKAN